jgi:hypothetical protein
VSSIRDVTGTPSVSERALESFDATTSAMLAPGCAEIESFFPVLSPNPLRRIEAAILDRLKMRIATFEMLSLESLQFIWDDRSRHGVDLVALMRKRGSPHLDELREIRRCRKRRRRARESYREAKRLGLPSEKKLRKLKKRSRQVAKSTQRYLVLVQRDLVDPGFRLSVTKGPVPSGSAKQTYRLESSTPDATYFAGRILQRDIVEAFEVKSAGRSDVVKTFVSVVQGKWTKSIVRADVSNFYESIPHDKLLDLVDSNHVVSALGRTWIHQIVASYAGLHSPRLLAGLPRGVGPSSSLAEAYLMSFDHVFKDLPECVFYARYVDDIVAVMAPVDARDRPPKGYLALIEDELRNRGLALSADPAKLEESLLDANSTVHRCSITLLGYQIDHSVATGLVELEMSPRRRDRLLLRLNRVFDIYERSASKTGLSAQLLESRVRLLAGNTRLINSKKDAFAGIRFSNSLLTKGGVLQRLDGILTKRIVRLSGMGVEPGIIARLKKASFVDGFEETRFVRFSSSEWRRISTAWRDLD